MARNGFTDADIARLAEALRLDEHAFIERHTRLASNRAQLSLREASDGACELLSGNRCSAYPARPDQCRDFPRTWRVDGCPGMKAEG